MSIKLPSVLMIRSNAIAPDPRVEKIARSLAEGGYRVLALGWDRAGDLPQHEDRAAYAVERIRLHGKARHGIGNLPQLLRWQVRLFAWLRRHRNEFEILHACDFDTLLPVLLCKRLYGQRVVYDIFDFYADMLRATPAWLTARIRRAEIAAIGQADAVILADDARREQIAGSHPRRLEVIYNSPPDEVPVFSPAAHSLACSLRIAYLGNLQRERGMFELLSVIAQHPEWHLDLGGFGPDSAPLQELAAGLPNVTWHGMVSYERVLQLNAGADVLLATYDPAIPNNRYSSPNKVFEGMLLQRPVVVAAGTNADRLVAEANSGVVVPYGSSSALEAAFTALAQDANLRLTLGKNGRAAYDQKYSWQRMTVRLLALYAGLNQSEVRA